MFIITRNLPYQTNLHLNKTEKIRKQNITEMLTGTCFLQSTLIYILTYLEPESDITCPLQHNLFTIKCTECYKTKTRGRGVTSLI